MSRQTVSGQLAAAAAAAAQQPKPADPHPLRESLSRFPGRSGRQANGVRTLGAGLAGAASQVERTGHALIAVVACTANCTGKMCVGWLHAANTRAARLASSLAPQRCALASHTQHRTPSARRRPASPDHSTPTGLVGLGARRAGCDGHGQQQGIERVAREVLVRGFGAHQASEVDLRGENASLTMAILVHSTQGLCSHLLPKVLVVSKQQQPS